MSTTQDIPAVQDTPAPGSGTGRSPQQDPGGRPLEVRTGHHELIIRSRYTALSIANDILIGVIFVVGSMLFFQESTTFVATWLFLVGSVLMLIRPCIRITRQVHLQRIAPHRAPADSWDF